MSLSDRLDLTRPDREKSKKLPTEQHQAPIWERIDLKRPEKPRCQVCRRRIETSWRICPDCGWLLQQQEQKHHCIWVQVSKLEVPENKRQMWSEILADAFSKVFSAFGSVNIFLTTENPNIWE